MVSWYLRSNPNEDALRQGASIRNITSTHYISTLLFKLLFSSGSEYICFLKPIQYTLVYQIRVPHQITAYRGTNLAVCYIKMQEIAHFLPIWMTK